jgi:hypothetical protein
LIGFGAHGTGASGAARQRPRQCLARG